MKIHLNMALLSSQVLPAKFIVTNSVRQHPYLNEYNLDMYKLSITNFTIHLEMFVSLLSFLLKEGLVKRIKPILIRLLAN